MQITFATGNAHKLKEITDIANSYSNICHSEGDVCLMPEESFKYTIDPSLIAQDDRLSRMHYPNNNIQFILPPDGFDPVEDGKTFEENSLIKAREAARLSGMMSLADDSGLCVEALNGAPGIYSARYAETPQARIDKLLNAVKGQTNRRAKFVCAMTLVDADGKILFQTRGECFGEISEKQAGTNGFGYDPVFYLKEYEKTMAELPETEKNKISHRSKALRKVLEFLIKNAENL